MKLIFASHNRHKAEEISSRLGASYEISTLHDLGCTQEIAETADNLRGNALIKARFVFEKYHTACFADDTGLEVEALDGEPGVFSARYAGEECNPEKNMQKLLAKLNGVVNRRAQFRTVVAYIDEQGEAHIFEGIVRGQIATQKLGNEGFGYDPIFIPNEADGRSFAQMTMEEKNEISHRSRAMAKFVEYLNHLNNK